MTTISEWQGIICLIGSVAWMLCVSTLYIAAYAVMSNHYHAVLHVNALQSGQWLQHEVISRWHQLFKGSLLCLK
jgi:predicted metal-dependent HD superfamily phosphohydrolase